MHNTRTLVLLEEPLRQLICRIARKEKISISSKCRDLIRQALSLEEDAFWDQTAAAREDTAPKHWLSHDDVWGR